MKNARKTPVVVEAPTEEKPEEKPRDTTIYLPVPLLKRLSDYTWKHRGGLQNQRTKIIIEAVDAFLTREGF